MSLDDDDSTWLIELESALIDGCSAREIYSICKGKSIPQNVRPDVWLACLNVHDAGNQLIRFNDIFDLSNQNVLRTDIKRHMDTFECEEEENLTMISELETMITFYCKAKNLNYSSDNGWIEILLPLLTLKLQKHDTYNLFERIIHLYIPTGCKKKGTPFHVLRLLLQYHDPELCSFLDTKRITPDHYSLLWFKSLFAGICKITVVQNMWDLYFQKADPFFIFFLSLIMIVNVREKLLQMKTEDQDTITKYLAKLPSDLNAEDVTDFCSLAHYYFLKTPISFRNDLMDTLFDKNMPDVPSPVSHALCISVSVHELVESATVEITPEAETVRFFLVDCRPAEQYNAGHLSTAFHLDCNLMLQEPAAFSTAVQGLLNAQRQALAAQSLAAGEHLCFVGSGRPEEDSYAHMVVASFLKRNTKHISMLQGGYVAIHEYFGSHMVDCLEEHNPAKCLVCAPDYKSETVHKVRTEKQTTPAIQLFGKLSAAMKSKSQEMKGKLIEYIINPNVTSPVGECHVSTHDRLEKRYRNVPPVFSIDDDVDNDTDASSNVKGLNDDKKSQEVISLDSFLKNPYVLNSFKCQEVLMNGYMHDSYLVLTETHLIVLRELHKKKGMALIIVRRPLSTVDKITAKVRHPELITFKYKTAEMDRFLIPNAQIATKTIANQIYNLYELDNA